MARIPGLLHQLPRCCCFFFPRKGGHVALSLAGQFGISSIMSMTSEPLDYLSCVYKESLALPQEPSSRLLLLISGVSSTTKCYIICS